MKSLACVKLHQITFFFDLFLHLFGAGSLGFSDGESTGEFGIIFWVKITSEDTLSDVVLLTEGTIDVVLCNGTFGHSILFNFLSTVVTPFIPVESKLPFS